jgi:YHS domain-containing protein
MVFVLHGTEEWWAGFYAVDPVFAWASRFSGSEAEAAFIGFQLTLWTLLALFVTMLMGPRWRIRALMVFGVIMVAELEHPVVSIVQGDYYPGTLTSLLFLPLAFVFWKELLRVRKMVSTDVMEIDPVCGMALHRGAASATVTLGGRVFAFCSEECRSRFTASDVR